MPSSAVYGGPFEVRKSAVIRAQGFRGETPVCVESDFYFYKLGPRPPSPDIHLAGLSPASVLGPGHSPSDHSHRFSPGSKPPQNNLSNRGEPLRLNGKTHERGVGVHAPSRIAYDIDPKWASFVALAGIDENIIETSNGSDLGCISSVVFRVFIDGELAAESPVMRFMLPPWRFDVEIPRGAETIALVVQPTEDGNREDVADWVEAGFVRRDGKTKAVRR